MAVPACDCSAWKGEAEAQKVKASLSFMRSYRNNPNQTKRTAAKAEPSSSGTDHENQEKRTLEVPELAQFQGRTRGGGGMGGVVSTEPRDQRGHES